ncbi:MAG: 23S rRNA (guanosine(2251)-2'-O)-methyltransferase RlmB [Piscirickettsiaceae bacterium]|nr:MAG: 23S rRNA (guanosine(2251)-2'-O)-methyltransferase RlmB [Piscirickettsiaceae bacterium]
MAELLTIYGIHAAQAFFENAASRVVNVWFDRQRVDNKLVQLKAALGELGLPYQDEDKKTLDKLAKGGNHQGVVITARLPQELAEDALKKALKQTKGNAFYLVLDQVTDPHNLGACLRTALAAGVQGVIVPKDNACRINATVCKVASGAAELLPVYRVTNLSRTLKWLKTVGVWLSGAAGEAEKSIFSAELSGSVAIVMGAEGKGLRKLTQQQCDQLIKIPMTANTESLNVSVAAGIILYEVVRQNGIVSI